MATNDFRELIERLHPDVARALEAPAAQAAQRGDEEVRIEHLLDELLDAASNPVSVARLDAAGVDSGALRAQIQARLALVPAAFSGRPAFGESLLRWLERGLLSATLHYRSAQITDAALIDALATMAPRMAGGDTFRALEQLDRARLRRAGGESARDTASARPHADEALARFTLDFTARAKAGELDPVLGRSAEIRDLIDVLGRRSKNNPILVGEPGVGKTALVEGLALRIHAGDVPSPLQRVRLLGLDLGLLQAGASVKGEFEQRLRDVIDAVQQSTEPVVLFIDEAHMLIGAGGEAGGSDAANLLKPALARGSPRRIPATTWSEYKRYFERDAALARRFQLVPVDEPDEDTPLRMLSGLRERLEAHHGVAITDAALTAAVRLSARYIPARQLPDKAIDLMDTPAARVRLGRAAAPHDLDAARETVTYLAQRARRLDQEIATGLDTDPADLDALAPELAQARVQRDRLEIQWRREQALCDEVADSPSPQTRAALAEAHTDGGYVHPEVGPAIVANVVADWTGVPLGRMLEDDIVAVLALEARMAERLVGQDQALARIACGLRSAKAGMRRESAPLGVFVLAGPSGVGKTEAARLLAERLFGSERALITINMSEYQEAHSVAQLKGAPPGYVGYGEGGVLTEAVRRRPYSVILLDEVEKAHRDVLNLFYQVFDQGSAGDGEGRHIDFRNTVVVMTSNLGAEALSALSAAGAEGDTETADPRLDPVEAIRPALQRHFGAALLARAEIVPFLPLDEAALAQVAALKLDALAGRLARAHGIELHCTPNVVAAVARQCVTSDSGARLVDRIIEQRLMPGLAQELLRYRAADDMPALARLEVNENGELTCVFADREPAADTSATA